MKIRILKSEGRLVKAHSDRRPSLRERWELWEKHAVAIEPRAKRRATD